MVKSGTGKFEVWDLNHKANIINIFFRKHFK